MGFVRNKKLLLFSGSALLLIISIIIVVFVISNQTDEPVLNVSGEAEAVMTTKVKVYDGIWDAKRYSDELYSPTGIVIRNGNLIVSDTMCDRIQIIDGDKNIRIGKPGQYGLSFLESGALVDGYRENALFAKPSGIAIDLNGDIIVCDTENHVIRRINDEFVITIAGNGERGYSEGRESGAMFNSPRGVAVGSDGTIYVADTMNHCIRQIDTEGNVTLYAGIPGQSGYGDGEPFKSMFYEPCGLFITDDGTLYIADSANQCIRIIKDGMVTTAVGRPGEVDTLTGYPESGYVDGVNENARFNFPKDVTVLADGTLIVADTLNHAIRAVTAENTRTIVGGGVADRYYNSVENLRLTRPEGVCSDGEYIYIADTANNCVVAVPINERIFEGRPSREAMLETTGVSTDSRYSYKGDIRVYIENERVDMGRVSPWNTADYVYIPIRPLFEALGAEVNVDEKTGILSITIMGQSTVLALDKDYFIMKGVAVTTADEVIRLFPYTFEWYPEFSLIALHVPSYLK